MLEPNVDVRLILADGTVLNNCECGYTSNSIWCFLRGISFSDAFAHFSDIDKFNMITFDLGFSDDFYDRITYTGFEELQAIQKNDYDSVDVRLSGKEIKIEKERIFKNENSV
jgi:hypothetical protein